MGFDDLATEYGKVQKLLTPVPYNDIDHNLGYDGEDAQDPTIGNFYQLLKTQCIEVLWREIKIEPISYKKI